MDGGTTGNTTLPKETNYRYDVLMFCDACSVPHPMGIGVWSRRVVDPDQSIGDQYDGRALPPEFATLTENTIICPATGKVILQRTNFHVFLMRVEA
jgi:hypothetical protein